MGCDSDRLDRRRGGWAAIADSRGAEPACGWNRRSFIIHVSGAIASGLVLFLRGGEKIRDWQTLPWYMLVAGVFGLILYLTISVTLPRLGSIMMVVLIMVGQLLVGVFIDHFGLLGVAIRPIDLMRVIGIALLALCACFIAR